MNGPAERFEALAASVLGRPVRVVWSDDGPTRTDGAVIELDPAHADHARHAVLVQSALLASGALAPELVRPLRGRPRRVDAYLRQAVPQSLEQVADRLPPTRWPSPTGDREPWWGTIDPARLIRVASTAPAPTDEVDVIGEPPQEPPDDAAPDDADDTARRTFRRRAVDQSGRRKKGRGSGRRTSEGEASVGRAVLGTSATPVPRVVGKGDDRALVVDAPGRAGAIARYPEWDERRGEYRPDWCHVHETHVSGTATGAPPHDVAADLRRTLARVHLDLATFRRQPMGADLDLDAVIDHRIEVRSGTDRPAHVFRDVRRARRDLGVLVLVDGSGSTGRGPVDGASVTDRQRTAAAALLEAFEALGDRVGCLIFRSHGRKRVEVTTVKGFDERLGGTTRVRLAGLRPEGFTRLGAAVRHGTRLLVERSGSRRWLLVVLSDGFPFDDGYEGRHAAADVSRALGEARQSGVGALCLGIGTTTPDVALQAVFGASTYATGPTITELGADLAELVRAALDGADRSRRISAE